MTILSYSNKLVAILITNKKLVKGIPGYVTAL